MSIIELSDRQQLPPAMRADRVDPLSAGGAIPMKGVSVISRDAPIVVQRQTESSSDSVLAMQSVGSIETVGTGQRTPEATYAERPGGYADDHLIKQAISAENSIGVTTTPRAVTVVPSPEPQRVVQRITQQPVIPSVTVGVQQTTQQVVSHRPKTRVRLSNAGMGKLTVSVQQLAVSDTLVILGYPKDADNIAEPPLCDAESPVIVQVGAETYKCMFGGWTAEMGDLFLVVLVRITE
jgi:hypothetical protein